MKRSIVAVPLEALKEFKPAEFWLELMEPGNIVEALLQVRQGSGLIVDAKTNAQKPELVPTFMVDVDPEGAVRKRHFYMVPPMTIVEGETVIYRGRFLFPNGQLMAVYEDLLDLEDAPPAGNRGEER